MSTITFKKILVPTDFSDLSYKALKAANVYAKIFGAKVVPFHAYIPLTDIDTLGFVGMQSLHSQIDYGHLENIIIDRLREAASKHVDAEYLGDPVCSVGNPSQSIVSVSEKYDLIIMSTHGRTGFSRFILGSVAEKVLRLSKTPVLIVEEESVLEPLKNIIVTTDFSENSYAAFPYAAAVAEKTKANVSVVHVVQYNEFEDLATAQTFADLRRDRLNKLIDQYFGDIKQQVKAEVLLTSGSAHEAIFNLTFSRDIQLVVMSTIGRTGLKHLALGSTTASIVRQINNPVLSINPRSK